MLVVLTFIMDGPRATDHDDDDNDMDGASGQMYCLGMPVVKGQQLWCALRDKGICPRCAGGFRYARPPELLAASVSSSSSCVLGHIYVWRCPGAHVCVEVSPLHSSMSRLVLNTRCYTIFVHLYIVTSNLQGGDPPAFL